MYYTTRHKTPLKPLDFLVRNFKAIPPPTQQGPRGANEEKVIKIKQGLLHLMPKKSQWFWNEIPINPESGTR